MIALSSHIEMIVAGRILCGLAASFSTANCSLLVSQYRWGVDWAGLNTSYFPHSTINNRGAFLSLFSLMLGLGILSCYCLGSLLYWRYVASIPPPLYLLLFCGLSRVPESPLWLLGHRGSKAAGQSLAWLRNSEDLNWN